MRIEAVPVGWTDDMDDRLRVSAGADLATIKQEVRQGIGQLWECRKNDRPEAWVVTRKDDDAWVIVLGEGRGFFDYMPLFVDHARERGLSLRTHVKRRGLIRMWERLGLHLDHYVLRG